MEKLKIKYLAVAAVVVFAGLALFGLNGRDDAKYQNALKQLNRGDYEAAEAAFRELGDSQDAPEMVLECRYRLAESLLAAYKYEEAEKLFVELGEYSNAKEMVLECGYQLAEAQMNRNDFENAQRRFSELGEYKDSANKRKACQYPLACKMLERKEYQKAETLFLQLGYYLDSALKVRECEYYQALAQFELGNYDKALTLFRKAKSYKDSNEYIKKCQSELLRTAFVGKWDSNDRRMSSLIEAAFIELDIKLYCERNNIADYDSVSLADVPQLANFRDYNVKTEILINEDGTFAWSLMEDSLSVLGDTLGAVYLEENLDIYRTKYYYSNGKLNAAGRKLLQKQIERVEEQGVLLNPYFEKVGVVTEEQQFEHLFSGNFFVDIVFGSYVDAMRKVFNVTGTYTVEGDKLTLSAQDFQMVCTLDNKNSSISGEVISGFYKNIFRGGAVRFYKDGNIPENDESNDYGLVGIMTDESDTQEEEQRPEEESPKLALSPEAAKAYLKILDIFPKEHFNDMMEVYGESCLAVLYDLNGDGHPELIVNEEMRMYIDDDIWDCVSVYTYENGYLTTLLQSEPVGRPVGDCGGTVMIANMDTTPVLVIFRYESDGFPAKNSEKTYTIYGSDVKPKDVLVCTEREGKETVYLKDNKEITEGEYERELARLEITEDSHIFYAQGPTFAELRKQLEETAKAK